MSDHKRWVSEVFDRAASQYGEQSCSFFNYFGKRLIEQVNVVLNQHTLNVATGRGAILFPLAEVVQCCLPNMRGYQDWSQQF
jgi:ubiquinone/menaquinone biosynthesis C-methylase UbiE